jgi:Carbohydrate-binding family 9
LYLEDVVEVFIDDNRDLKTYIEIEVNPLNALLHYYIQNNLVGEIAGFARVNKNVETAVYKPEGKNNWSVEIAIPFSEFVTSKKTPPDSGDVWLVNFYRIDRRNPDEDEYSAWSPTGKIAFHMPEKFGELVFVD